MTTTMCKPVIDMTAPEPLKTVNQSAAARALRLNVSNISRILRRERVPHLHTFYHLSLYLGLTLDQLYSLLYPDK